VNRGPDDRSGPDHTADEFDEIVAGLRREGEVPAWPREDRPPTEPHTPSTPAPPRPSASDAEPGPSAEGDPHADHFVPPEPPPLPRIGPPAAVGITLLGLGLTLVVSPAVVGVSQVYGLPLGLVSLAAGLGWLVLRLWPGPPDDRDADDDGAIL
jgi:hypothetical protein